MDTELKEISRQVLREWSYPDDVIDAFHARQFVTGPHTRTAIANASHEESQRAAKGARQKRTVQLRVHLTREQKEILESNNPTIHVNYLPQEFYASHALAQAQKRIDDFMVSSLVADVTGNIMDIGGNYTHHVQRGDTRVHSPFLARGVQDSIRAVTRELTAKVGARQPPERDVCTRVVEAELIAHVRPVGSRDTADDIRARRRNAPEGGWYCTQSATDCHCARFDAAIMNHCYDLPLADLVKIMVKNGMDRLVGAIHGNVDMLVPDVADARNDSDSGLRFGHLRGVNMDYVVDEKEDTILFLHSGENVLAYSHKYTEYVKYLVDHRIAHVGRYDYFYKVLQRNGDSIIFRVFKVPHSSDTGLPKTHMYLAPDRELVKMTGWFLPVEYAGTYKSREGLESQTRILPKYVVDLAEQRAHERVIAGSIIEGLVAELSNWSTTISVNGIPIQGLQKFRTDDLQWVAVNLLCKAQFDDFVSRQQTNLMTAKDAVARDSAQSGLFSMAVKALREATVGLIDRVSSGHMHRFLSKLAGVNAFPVEIVRLPREYHINRPDTVEMTSSVPVNAPVRYAPALQDMLRELVQTSSGATRADTSRDNSPGDETVGATATIEEVKEPEEDRVPPVPPLPTWKRDWYSDTEPGDTEIIEYLEGKGHKVSDPATDFETRRQSIRETREYYRATLAHTRELLRTTWLRLSTGTSDRQASMLQALTGAKPAVAPTYIPQQTAFTGLNLNEARKSPDIWTIAGGHVTGKSVTGRSIESFKYSAVYDPAREVIIPVEFKHKDRTVVDVRVPGMSDGQVLTDDNLEVFVGEEVLAALDHALEMPREEVSDYRVTFVCSIGGAGKSYIIKTNCEEGHLATAPTRLAASENREGIAANGKVRDAENVCRSMDSFLVNWRRYLTRGFDVVWCDEVGLAPQGLLHAIAFLSRTSEVVAMWDPFQIIHRERINRIGEALTDSALLFKRLSTVSEFRFKWVSRRVPAEILACVSHLYFHRARTAVTRKGILRHKTAQIMPPTRVKGQWLAFTQAEKDTLLHSGYRDALTVNEAEGGEWSTVNLYTYHLNEHDLYKESDFLVTLFTRSKQFFNYYQNGARRNEIQNCFEKHGNVALVRALRDVSSAGKPVSQEIVHGRSGRTRV